MLWIVMAVGNAIVDGRIDTRESAIFSLARSPRYTRVPASAFSRPKDLASAHCGRCGNRHSPSRSLTLRRTTDLVEEEARVTRCSTFTVRGILYSVPSRLIGHRLKMRVSGDRLDGYLHRSTRTLRNALTNHTVRYPMDAGPWNMLEVAKLVTGVLSPVTIAAIGVYIHRITKRFEHVQWRSQKLIEKRLAIYDDLAPLMNDLLCYFTFVGAWRDLDPPQVIAMKRAIDKKVYLASPLFSSEFFSACMKLQQLCFQPYVGWGLDARLRTSPLRRKEAKADWKTEWNTCFSEAVSDPGDIRSAYVEIMTIFANDIGVNASAIIPPTGRTPGNFR